MTVAVVWQGKAPFSLWIKNSSYSCPLPPTHLPQIKTIASWFMCRCFLHWLHYGITGIKRLRVLNKTARAVLEVRHRACLWIYSASHYIPTCWFLTYYTFLTLISILTNDLPMWISIKCISELQTDYTYCISFVQKNVVSNKGRERAHLVKPLLYLIAFPSIALNKI